MQSRGHTPVPSPALRFDALDAPDGTWDLYAHADSYPTLRISGLSHGDEDAELGARALLELLGAARRGRTLRDEGDGAWLVPTPMFDIPVRCERTMGWALGFVGPRGPGVVDVCDHAVSAAGTPRQAMGMALTALGVHQIEESPRLAAQALARAVRLHPGDPTFPDDTRDTFGNHNNHLAWGALSRLAARDGDDARADALLREHLTRSYAAQMSALGGRLAKIEGAPVPRRTILEELGAVVWTTLYAYDSASRGAIGPGLVGVRSPVLIMGARGQAVQQLLIIPETWARLYFEGPARVRLTDGDALALAADAIAAHRRDVTPLVRATMAMPLFDPSLRAEEVETSTEYFSALQLWSSVLALIAHWTAAGLSDAQIRACLVLDESASQRREGLERWDGFMRQLVAEAAEAHAGP